MLENVCEHDSFLQNALTIRGSVTPKVISKVIWVILYASLISFLNYWFPDLVLPIGPFEYGGLIMGLILVFRVNAGYDRWWEGRKLWGNVVNDCRNLAIILNQYVVTEQTKEWKMKLCYYTLSFPYLIKDHLRNNKDSLLSKEYFDENAYLTITQADTPCIVLGNLIAKELNYARVHNLLDSFAFIRAEETRSRLLDAFGACERILKTPMPFVMAVKSRRFILCFLVMLPLGLINISNLFISPVISGLVAYALFALDQIGVELQNPFSDKNLSHLPLDKICNTISQDVLVIFDKSSEA
ncbi:MAG: bestrophin family ion channel [Gammaproteobacteria bacterium]